MINWFIFIVLIFSTSKCSEGISIKNDLGNIVNDEFNDDISSPDQFGGFFRNIFERAFDFWPFSILDDSPLIIPFPSFDKRNNATDRAVNHTSVSQSDKWVPLNFTELCSKLSKSPKSTCGGNKINIKRLCKQIKDGASVQGYCLSNNGSVDDSSLRITISYGNKTKHNSDKSMSDPSRNKQKSIVNETVIKIFHNQSLLKDDENSNIQAENETANELTKRDVIDIEQRPTFNELLGDDISLDTLNYKIGNKDNVNWSIYGVAMTAGALGTVVIMLMLFASYTLARIVKIKRITSKVQKANSERKRILRLQKLSSLVSDESETEH